MPSLSRDSTDEIKERLPVHDVIKEYLKLEKSGINYRAVCPFHKEKTPSFFVSPSRQLWRCFGCGEGGDIFTFVEKIEGVGFPEALKLLGSKAGVQVDLRQNKEARTARNTSLEICSLAAKYFNIQLASKNGQLIQEYLKNRGISEKSIEEFFLGYAPLKGESLIKLLRNKGYKLSDMERAGVVYRKDTGEYISRFRGRIIFPISNLNGDVVGFGARKIDADLAKQLKRRIPEESPKYINSPQTHIYDKSSVMYGLHRAKMDIRKQDGCVVVEGYTDVILAHQNGFKNVVSSSGTSLTENQLKILKRFTNNLYTAFDMDAAGDIATKRGIDAAQREGLDVRVIALNKGSDPADIIQKDKKEWERAIENAKSVSQFYFDSAFENYNSTTPEGKRNITLELAHIFKNIPSTVEQSHWVQKLASKLGVNEEDVWNDINKIASTQTPKENNALKSETPSDSSFTKKSRKELIKKAIYCYAFDDKKNMERLRKRTPALYKEVNNAFQDKEFTNNLAFEIDVAKSEGKWQPEEFPALIAEYKKIVLGEEMKDLQARIKKNEAEDRHEENKKLLEKFNKKAARRAKLT